MLAGIGSTIHSREDLRRLAHVLIESKEDLLRGMIRINLAHVGDRLDEQAVSDELLVNENIFRCTRCSWWRCTSRMHPDAGEWCIECWNEEHPD